MKQEKVGDANTADEMRAELFRLRCYNPLVRNILDRADFSGMSAEDRYVFLSYYAIKQNVDLQNLLLEQTMSTFMTPVIIKEEK